MNTATLYLTCVISLVSHFEGIVVSRNIYDQKTGETWVIIETKDGARTENIDNLKEKPCSGMGIEDYSNSDSIFELLGECAETTH